MARAPRGRRLVLFAAVPPVRMLDIVAPLHAFSEANRVSTSGPEYEIRVISGAADENLSSDGGLTLQSETAYPLCLNAADTLLVAGSEARVPDPHGERFLQWLQGQASRSRRIGAVSAGVFLLAEAGLLNGKRATTDRRFHHMLSRRFPGISIERQEIYVRDANLYTCAGATASLDLTLSMVEEDLGPSVAAEVAQSMLLYRRQPGSAPQVSPAPRAQAVPATPIAELVAWLPENLQQDLSIATLARRTAMSPRNFARIFKQQLGQTPAKYIGSLRLEAARFQLESSELTVDGVAYVTGLENGDTLRRLFVRRLGLTPGRYRLMNASRDQNTQAHQDNAHTAPRPQARAAS